MYKRYLKLNLEHKDSIFLWGARKTGKSTYLNDVFHKSARFDFLNSELFIKYTKSPWIFREDVLSLDKSLLELPIIIDEVQKVPAIMDEIHLMIETYKLSFILCGSSARKMRQRGINLLGGRAIRYHFYPLVYPEIKDNFDLLRIFNNGLIPLHYSRKNADDLLKTYLSDYLIYEVQAEALIRDIAAFMRFVESVGFSHGQLVNYSNIARDVGISSNTVKEHYQILVDTLVGYLLDPYRKSAGRDIISTIPKFYFFDVGVANSLIGTKIVNLKGIEAGRSLEHYIFLELHAYINLNSLYSKIAYWRTHSGIEIDFIIHIRRDTPIPIEVKISETVHKTELKNMKIFMKEYGVKTGYIVCMCDRARRHIFEEGEIIIYSVREFLEDLWAGKIIKE
jgi:predicted AAA+ superfamily ATPase